jgi:hypothetical protein
VIPKTPSPKKCVQLIPRGNRIIKGFGKKNEALHATGIGNISIRSKVYGEWHDETLCRFICTQSRRQLVFKRINYRTVIRDLESQHHLRNIELNSSTTERSSALAQNLEETLQNAFKPEFECCICSKHKTPSRLGTNVLVTLVFQR